MSYISSEFSGGRRYSASFFSKDGELTGGQPKLYFIGIEIEKEYEGRDSNVLEMVEAVEAISNEFFSNTDDGSLDNGIEFQSMPATFDYHKKLYDDGYYTKFFNELDRWELESKSSCGSHVHVSRNALTRKTLRKMIELMYTTFSDRFMVHIARRDFARTSWAYRSFNGNPLTDSDKDRLSRGDNDGKYMAMNNYNRQTCEFRIWNSPESAEELMQQIEFVVALKRYARRTELEDLSESGFITYVRRRGRTYPHLKAHISSYARARTATIH